MKKMICILITVMIIVSALSFGVSAQATVTPDPNNKFEEILINKYSSWINPDRYEYKELEYHYDENNEVDWALVYARYGPFFEPDICCAVACGRVWYNIILDGPGYAIYDAKKQTVEFVFSADWSKYEGIEEAVARAEIGYPVGDSDFDGKLTVLDATKIQRSLAGLSYFDRRDTFDDQMYAFMNDENLKYMSDFDRDGERTVLDATAIQYKLAGLEY